MTNVVIVGAGYAGILTAKKLAKKFKKDDSVNITIIDKNPYHTMLTELHEVAACRVDESSIRINLEKVFAGRKVNVVLDSVETIDFDNKVVVGATQKYEYDYVVMAAGSKPTYFGIEGAKEFTHTLWSYDDAVELRDHIHNTFLEASRASSVEERRHLLTFYVVGAGFTGVEMMGELAEYVPILCAKHNIPTTDVTMVNVDAMDRSVPVLPVKLSNKVERRLEKMGVKMQLNSKVQKITENSIELDVNGTIETYDVHTVIWTAGIESSDITTESGKSIEAAQRGGRIETDSFLRAKGREDVYVVGDNMYYIVEGEERPVPQMVENAEHSAGTAAKNLTEAIRGGNNMKAYTPSFHGMMVCIGGRYGVARVGFPSFMFNLPSFLAMLSKHFINMVYFVQILGWNKVFSYLKAEIFTIRNRRSFVGGHFSNRTPSFVVVPFRIWLGAVWLFEGLKKVQDGWMGKFTDGKYAVAPKLEEFFGWANAFYDGIFNGADGSSAGSKVVTLTNNLMNNVADVASTSSEVVGEGAEAAGEIIFNLNFLNLFQAWFVTGQTLMTSGLGDFAFKINMPMMNWFVDNIILSSDGMQIVMQITVVVFEILIGLALIGGLFTTISAAVSVALQIMFLMTTGLYLDTIWMLFGGIAVLFSGATFGLDYWVMPWLKNWWSNRKFVKKWYIYHD